MFNDACENACQMFRSHAELGSRTNKWKIESVCTLCNLKPNGKCNSEVLHL